MIIAVLYHEISNIDSFDEVANTLIGLFYFYDFEASFRNVIT